MGPFSISYLVLLPNPRALSVFKNKTKKLRFPQVIPSPEFVSRKFASIRRYEIGFLHGSCLNSYEMIAGRWYVQLAVTALVFAVMHLYLKEKKRKKFLCIPFLCIHFFDLLSINQTEWNGMCIYVF